MNKSIFKILSVLLIISFVMTGFTSSFAETGNVVTEEQIKVGKFLTKVISPGSDYKPIINGYSDGQLHLDWNITRAEMAVIVYRVLPSIPVYGIKVPHFTDTNGHWCDNTVYNLRRQGVIDGVGNNLFKPNQNISIYECYLMTLKMLKYKLDEIGDQKAILAKVHELGLDSGIYREPNDRATRGEAFLIVYHALEADDQYYKTKVFAMDGLTMIEGVVTGTSDTNKDLHSNSLEITKEAADNIYFSEPMNQYLGHRVKAYAFADRLLNVLSTEEPNIIDGGFVDKVDGKEIKLNGNIYNLTDYQIYLDRESNNGSGLKPGMYIRLVQGVDNIKRAVAYSFDNENDVIEKNVIYRGVDGNGRLKYSTEQSSCGILDTRYSGELRTIALHPVIYKGKDVITPDQLSVGDIINIQQSNDSTVVVVVDSDNRRGVVNSINGRTIEIGKNKFVLADDATYSWNSNSNISIIPRGSIKEILLNREVSYRLNSKEEVRHIFYGETHDGSKNVGIILDKKEEKVGTVTKRTLCIYDAYTGEEKDYQMLSSIVGIDYVSLNTFKDSSTGYDVIYFDESGGILSKAELLNPVAIKSPKNATLNGFDKYSFDRTTPFVKVNLTKDNEYDFIFDTYFPKYPIVNLQYSLMFSRDMDLRYPYKASNFNNMTFQMYKLASSDIPLLFIIEE